MSFGWNMMFRKGSWEEFRRFALLQRQNVPDRVLQINRELSKIGSIRVGYARSIPEDKNSPLTERRVSLDVQTGSSLCKLLQAYIARGGNPFDISMFLIPDSYTVLEEGLAENQPYHGVIAPLSKNDDDMFRGLDTSGWLPLWRYPYRKLGKKVSYWGLYGHTVGSKIESSKTWLTQEIKELRNDLEARIIKLCDLREQLLIERDEILIGAVGDAVPMLPYDTQDFSLENHLFSVITFIDRVFYQNGENGLPDRASPREDSIERPFPTLLGDAPTGEEDFTAIG